MRPPRFLRSAAALLFFLCARHALAQAPTPKDHTGLKPLTEMTADDRYKGEDGGLYGGGKNVPPAAHLAAAKTELAKVKPVDGKIVLLALGMSNTTQEFSAFQQLANADPAKSPALVIVDGAQGGQAAAQWASKDAKTWPVVDERLKAAGATAQQVQILWIKQAEIRPSSLGEYPEHAKKLTADIAIMLNLAKERFPNLRVAYLSSRTYAGWATSPLNPEPYAYESAFAVRSLILAQIAGKDPALKVGDKCPVLLWGPYLWADGVTPRKADKLVWEKQDVREKDGTHPSDSGRRKVAQMLLDFFKTDEGAKSWFAK